MISQNTLDRFRDKARRRIVWLDLEELSEAAQALLVLHAIREETVDDEYLNEALELFQSVAPSMALHLRTMLNLARTLTDRTP